MPELQLTLVDKTDKHMYAANLLLKREFGHTLDGFQSTLFAQKVEAFEPQSFPVLISFECSLFLLVFHIYLQIH